MLAQRQAAALQAANITLKQQHGLVVTVVAAIAQVGAAQSPAFHLHAVICHAGTCRQQHDFHTGRQWWLLHHSVGHA